MPSYPGVWRAVVLDNNDPEQRNRLILQIPSVVGTAASGWALPCLPPGFTGPLPDPGTQVWVAFEGADPSHPVWIGTW